MITLLDDPGRLAALAARGLPDASAEASFDRLTRWAQRGLHTDGAYINFIDDVEHVCKSTAGLQPPERSMPIAMSLCASAVRDGEVVAVEDVATDPVLSTHPIAEVGVRGYLAVPLRTADGRALGTICVIDLAARARRGPCRARTPARSSRPARGRNSTRRSSPRSSASWSEQATRSEVARKCVKGVRPFSRVCRPLRLNWPVNA